MALNSLTSPALVILALGGLLAGCAFIAEQRAATREARWEANHPPLGRLVQVEGRQVHVYEAGQPVGSAPDLVLIHGANGNLRDFTFDLVGRLAGAYRIVAVDRPGLGWSDSWGEADSDPAVQARVLRRALAPLGLERPVVLGHSYGAAVALAWALEAEEEIGALVMLGGATHPWPGDLGLWYRLAASWPGQRVVLPAVAAFAPLSRVEGVIAEIFAPQPVPEGYAAHIGVGLTLRPDALRANAAQVNGLKPYVAGMAAAYHRLALPIEIVHGDADTIVGLGFHSERMVAEVASARLTRLPGIGHMPQHTAPEAVIAAIDRAARRAGLR